MGSIALSIEIPIPASLIATSLGTAAAYALIRGRVPGAIVISGCLMLPIVVPAIITAAGLYSVYRGLGLNGTLTGLIIGHIVLITPYVVATVSASLRIMDARLEDTAATLGPRPGPVFAG
jgi:ABC-type spermidine/putrescine transport system permease subunit II